MSFIYTLSCPITGSVRYVGKTDDPDTRLAKHISKARLKQTNHHCAHWIRKLLADGLAPIITIVYQVGGDERWQDAERRFIKQYRDAGCDLTNLTDGGDGFHGAPKEVVALRIGRRQRTIESSPELRKRWSDSTKETWADPKVRAKREGASASFWSDAKNKERMVQSMRTPDAVANRAAATSRRNADPEFAAAHKVRMKALYRSPERLEQLRAANAKRWSVPRAKKVRPRVAPEQARINHADGLRKAWSDPKLLREHRDRCRSPARRAKLSKLLKAREAKMKASITPEVIARRNAAIKAAWARRKAAT